MNQGLDQAAGPAPFWRQFSRQFWRQFWRRLGTLSIRRSQARVNMVHTIAECDQPALAP